MWGSVFFSGFWKRGGTRGERYFMEMHGRRCWNSELFFHRLREVKGRYIYFGEGVLCWKNSFILFFGGFVLHIFQRNFFCVFFFGYHETTGYSSLDFFLSSYFHFFSSIFSLTFKRHFLPPFFVLPSFFGILIFRPFLYSSSYQMFLIVFLVVFLGFTYSFIFIYLSNSYNLFFFSYFFQFVVVYFLYPSILFSGLQDAGKE